MTEDGKILKERLDSFQIEQISKFFAVRDKHKGDDICDNQTDWSKYDLWGVWSHLLDELVEVRNLLYDRFAEPKKTESIDLKQLRMECVDLANMAFILGEVVKERQIQRLAAALPDDFDPDPVKR